MAKKGSGKSVVNLGAGASSGYKAGAIDLVKRMVGSKIGAELTGGSVVGAALGSRAARGLKKGGVVGKKGT